MRLVLLLLSSISLSAIAAEGWYENGDPVADKDWRKHDGPFKAHLFLSEDPESVYEQWNEGPTNKVTFEDLTKIESGRHFEAIIVFAGCSKNDDGQCVVTGNWVVESEDGTTLGVIDDAPIYIGPGPVQAEQLMISTNGIGIPAAASDGGYRISVTVKDAHGKRSVALERSIDVE